MAKISHSDLAPAEKVHYSLAGAEFDLTAKGSYETDNAEAIANARSHPWLTVEVSEVAADADGEAPVEVHFPAVAVEAGLDQKEVEFVGDDEDIAETLAAEKTQDDEVVVEEPANDPVPAEEKE
jgi:hypothetical protein